MSEDNKNFGKGEGDDAINKMNQGKGDLKNEASEAFEEGKKSTGESMRDKAKDFSDKANEQFEEAKEKASEFADETREAAKDFGEEAKKTANEFSEGAREAFEKAGGENKKLVAGILAIVLGSLGIHKFVLGYQKEGIIMLVVTLLVGSFTCGIGASIMGIIGLIEGIIYLTKSDTEFYNTYQVGRKPWF